jgi:hypothetical protein
MKHSGKDRSAGPAPESAMGGASDAGASGGHPASRASLDPSRAMPDQAPGDAPIERRRAHDPGYRGPERRVAHRR